MASLLLKDFVAEQSNAPGTGTFSLGIAVAGRMSWVSSFANGASAYYYATDGVSFECGIGTLTYGTPNTLARTTILANSSGTTSVVNFIGLVTVYNEVPAVSSITSDLFATFSNASGTSYAGSAVALPGRRIIQGGNGTTNAGTGGISIPYPVTFTNVYSLTANLIGSGPNGVCVTVGGPSLTGFTAYGTTMSSGGAYTTPVAFYWTAFGTY